MYSHILVAVDPGHGEVGERLVAVARHLAGPETRITLLSVLEPVPRFVATYVPQETVDRVHAETRQTLGDLARSAGVEGEIVLGQGNAANSIIAEVERLGCDAIVIGSHRPDYRDYLIGSTAARVVRHAPCTVVVERTTQIRL
jgi:universal stress protein F